MAQAMGATTKTANMTKAMQSTTTAPTTRTAQAAGCGFASGMPMPPRGANVVDYDNQFDARAQGTATEGLALKSGQVAVCVRQAANGQAEQAVH